MKILLVEDDRPTAIALSKILTDCRLTVELASDGETAFDLATSFEYDLIILDIVIPKLDGISLCQRLRQQKYSTPILLLTAKFRKADIIRGLEAGADDYVIKPYDPSELIARIHSLLRRKNSAIASVLTWGNLTLNSVSGEVTYNDQKIAFSPTEYHLLELFLSNPQRLFSRSTIIDRLWKFDDPPTEKAITTHIKDIRKKLREVGCTEEIVETVYGLGYRLMPPPYQLSVTSDQLPAIENEGQNKPQSSIAKVLERFKHTFVEQIEQLEATKEELLKGNLSAKSRENSEQEAHKLAGSLGTFGYPEGSKLAREIEHLLMKRVLGEQEALRIEQLIKRLKAQLQKPPILPTENYNPIALNAKILTIDDDLALGELLKTEAVLWKVEMEIACDLNVARKSLQQKRPDLILLNLTFPKPHEDAIAFLEELRKRFPITPILVFTERDDLSTRVAVSRLEANKFLHKPMTAAEIFGAIAEVLCHLEAKVMIVEDDALFLSYLSERLESLGIQVTTLEDPQQFWEVLTATIPDLLILDLKLPEYNGLELCRVVRQDACWEDLPIIFITAYSDRESTQKIFAAGADDVINKPFDETELISRIFNRINRDRSRKKQEKIACRSK
ncbi:MAG: response regulator [Hydrococcus sp. Prado102]|jgi:DNA-binding response OmpR family regulator|nr:response regulator [Hydrococcus sp. Prado102]